MILFLSTNMFYHNIRDYIFPEHRTRAVSPGLSGCKMLRMKGDKDEENFSS
jgi:hypothetical protein